MLYQVLFLLFQRFTTARASSGVLGEDQLKKTTRKGDLLFMEMMQRTMELAPKICRMHLALFQLDLVRVVMTQEITLIMSLAEQDTEI